MARGDMGPKMKFWCATLCASDLIRCGKARGLGLRWLYWKNTGGLCRWIPEVWCVGLLEAKHGQS